DGSIRVKAEYDFADFYYDGRAVVSKGGVARPKIGRMYYDGEGYQDDRSDMRANYWGGKWSVLNQSGQVVTKMEYEYIRDYNEGRAAFNKGGIWKSSRRYDSPGTLISGRWGFLDKEGNEIIAPVYDYVYDFENGIAKVRLGDRVFWVDRDGKEVAPPTQTKRTNALSIFCDPGFYGFIDQTGKWAIEPQFIRAGIFSEGLAAVVPMRASDNVCEVASKNDIDYDYLDDAYRLRLLKINMRRSSRYEPVEAVAEAPLRRLYGYIDAAGKMMIEPKYDLALPFQNGRAYVCFRDKWGIIDKKGNWVVQPVLDWPPSMTDGFERNRRRSYMYLDSYPNGKVKEPYVDNLHYDVPYGKTIEMYQFNEGMGVIYSNGRYGVVDTTGKIIVPPVYNTIRTYKQGVAAVELNERWGFIDKTGKEVIPVSFLSVGNFTKEGLAWARYSNLSSDAGDVEQYEADVLYGFIDLKGAWVIKPKFVYLSEFSEGLAVASVDYTSKGYIDQTGTFIIPPKYNAAYDFNNGLAWVSMPTFDAVYIDKKGKVSKEYVPNKKDPPQAENKLIWNEDATGRIGYKNSAGDWVIKPEYSIAGWFSRIE
ncbi:MAG: WG repeat-containing protein, partial [Bacteroidia bacterium]